MRLFVAINLPPDLRESIWNATGTLRSAGLPVRWMDETALHLTLKFLGETDAGRVPEIVAAVEAATRGAKVFALPLEGFGAFPSLERPRVIWVGCQGGAPLELLQHALELEMERLDFPVEGRPFRPHLTLGRVRRQARPASFRDLGNLLENLDYQAEAVVESVELMESASVPGGARYQPIHSVALGGRS